MCYLSRSDRSVLKASREATLAGSPGRSEAEPWEAYVQESESRSDGTNAPPAPLYPQIAIYCGPPLPGCALQTFSLEKDATGVNDAFGP